MAKKWRQSSFSKKKKRKWKKGYGRGKKKVLKMGREKKGFEIPRRPGRGHGRVDLASTERPERISRGGAETRVVD